MWGCNGDGCGSRRALQCCVHCACRTNAPKPAPAQPQIQVPHNQRGHETSAIHYAAQVVLSNALMTGLVGWFALGTGEHRYYGASRQATDEESFRDAREDPWPNALLRMQKLHKGGDMESREADQEAFMELEQAWITARRPLD